MTSEMNDQYPQDLSESHQRSLTESADDIGYAHDINNFLQVAYSSLCMIERNLQKPEVVIKWLSVAKDSAARCSDLAREIMSRDRPGRVHEATVCVQSTLDGLETVLRAACGPDVSLAVQATGTCQVHCGSRSQLEQAIFNLVINARDALRGSGRIVVSSGLYAGEVWIVVDDDGPGIPPSLRERVFERYYTDKPGGSGLGLASVRAFAERSRGSTRVLPSPLGGARVAISLPQVQGNQPVPHHSNAPR